MRVADRVILMDQGKIVEDGSPLEVFTSPSSEIGLRYRKLWETRYVDAEITGRKRKAVPVQTHNLGKASAVEAVGAGTSFQLPKSVSQKW
jgi:ABC-type glutathione transport system ATPase component